MERYDQLYRLYDEFDTAQLRSNQNFADLFPPVDSRVALEHWQEATDEIEAGKDAIRQAFPEVGETFAGIAANATREQAFTALDLYTKYQRAVNVLVLDVDETLRSAGRTDNEIPRDTLYALTEFFDDGVPIVVCTGQTLENVKGFLIQGLGNEIVHSGSVSIVYEAGTGAFTPGQGSQTKQLLYENLDAEIQTVFERLRSRVLADAPENIRQGSHLQGNEFNITVKPNFETGGGVAVRVIDNALIYLLDLLGDTVADARLGDGWDEPETTIESRGNTDAAGAALARGYYAQQDPEIRTVLEEQNAMSKTGPEDVPDAVFDTFERTDVAYYEGDAAEIGSLELNKVAGVKAAFDVLDIDNPFTLVMGDSKSDLRVMRWVDENDAGIGAAPEHASRDVLDHVLETDELVFDPGEANDILKTVYALNGLAKLDD